MDYNGLQLVSGPAKDPVTLAEFKAMLKMEDIADDDALKVAFLKGAVAMAENFLSRCLITQTWEMTADRFPRGSIVVPYGSLQTVDTITYIDSNGDEQTWDDSLYQIDSSGVQGRIRPAYAEFYPTTQCVMNAVTVRFTCGYGDDPGDVPENIRLAILLTARLWYDNRASGEMPPHCEAFLWPHRILSFS